MLRIKISVMRKASYEDLVAEYENPIEHTCELEVGRTFIVKGCNRPMGLCESAWESMYPFVSELANGGGNFFDGWTKNPESAMISCNDGFRPVSFLLEVVGEEMEGNE